MGRWSADEAVVIVKPGACDPVVTSVRVKHRTSARKGGGEGRNTEAGIGNSLETVGTRSARMGTGEWPGRIHRPNQRRRLLNSPREDESEMSGRDLLMDERRLFEDLCTAHWLKAGFRHVRENKGSPGIDGMSIKEFEGRLDEELSRLREELQSWTYQPSPVRRVEIPKPGGRGTRLLGVPTVRDRQYFRKTTAPDF